MYKEEREGKKRGGEEEREGRCERVDARRIRGMGRGRGGDRVKDRGDGGGEMEGERRRRR